MQEKIMSLNKDDFTIQVFRCGGPGGQKQNKTSSGVRILHKDSGASGESRTHRSQSDNKKEAFRRLTGSVEFKSWLKVEIARKSGRLLDIEHKVEEQMCEDNLSFEMLDSRGRWIPLRKEEEGDLE